MPRAPLAAPSTVAFILFGQTLSWMIRPPYRVRLFFQAMDFIGVGSVAIVCLVGLFSGMVFALQSVEAFNKRLQNELCL